MHFLCNACPIIPAGDATTCVYFVGDDFQRNESILSLLFIPIRLYLIIKPLHVSVAMRNKNQ